MRGRFDYASVSSFDLSNFAKFSIFVMSDEFGKESIFKLSLIFGFRVSYPRGESATNDRQDGVHADYQIEESEISALPAAKSEASIGLFEDQKARSLQILKILANAIIYKPLLLIILHMMLRIN